jgi:hypothetical protein
MPTQTHDVSDRALVDLPEARRYVFGDENYADQDDRLVDNIDGVSAAIATYCEREFVDTTVSDRSGADGVGNGTTTFVSASAAFATTDVGSRIRINGTMYVIVSRTNATTVVLNGTVATGTGLSWDFGEVRTFRVTSSGYVDFRPYDLRYLQSATLYADRADLEDDILTADEYQLVVQPNTVSSYDLRVMAPAYAPLHEGFDNLISVRGWWGMSAVPYDVRMACKQWVKNLTENPGNYASHTMSGYTVVPDMDAIAPAPAGMPAAVRFRLEDFRRGYEFR